jgi:hypothetical protein
MVVGVRMARLVDFIEQFDHDGRTLSLCFGVTSPQVVGDGFRLPKQSAGASLDGEFSRR